MEQRHRQTGQKPRHATRARRGLFCLTPEFRQRLTAWLGVVVLAVNLFGWTLAPDAGALSPPLDNGTIAQLFPSVLSGQDICEHDDDGKGQHGGSHDKMVCPACFPMGNAASGALLAAGANLPSPLTLVVARQTLPRENLGRSAFHPFQYQARAPPRLA